MNGIGIEQYGDEMALKLVYVPTEPLGPIDLLISIKASGGLESAERAFERKYSL